MSLKTLCPLDYEETYFSSPPSVDIVLVHGFHEEATDTWTHETTKVFWPEKLLPLDIPDVRVMIFRYLTAELFDTSAPIPRHADSLLLSLSKERVISREQSRPIIFIGHSLGGIVIKRALLSARYEEQYASIIDSTMGLIFFATPHRGSNKGIPGNLTSIATDKEWFLICTLEDNRWQSLDALFKFRHSLSNYKIFTFYETKPIERIGMIVDKESARLEVPDERQIPVPKNHVQMCKFRDWQDHTYVQLLRSIRRILGIEIDDPPPSTA